MNKQELVDAIALDLDGVRKNIIEKVLTSALEQIVQTVVNGDRVTLVGFGSFEARTRKEREGRNPQTGDRMVIPPTTVPVFSAGKTFKQKVN